MRAINKSPKRFSKKIIALAAVIVILLAGAAFLLLNRDFIDTLRGNSDSNVNYDEPSSDQKDAGVEIKRENNNPLNSAKNDSDQPTSPTPTDEGSKQTVPVTINYASQDTNSDLNVRAIINTIDEDSTCTLSLVSAGVEIYTQTVDTFAQSSYTACGFTVNKDKFPQATNTLTATISYRGNAHEGSASKEVAIK